MDYEQEERRYLKIKQYGFWGIFMIVLASSAIIIGVIISAVFLYKMYSAYGVSSRPGLDTNTTIGTFIGGVVGPLITLASVLLLFLNLRMQRLTLQAQTYAQEQQTLYYQRQQFEVTFYKLLDYQDELLKNIKAEFLEFGTFDIEEQEGTAFFNASIGKLQKIYYFVVAVSNNKELSPLKYDSQDIELHNMVLDFGDEIRNANTELQIAMVSYNIFFNANHQYLGHYFRHLFHIMKFIRTEELKETQILESDIMQVFINGERAGLSVIHSKYKYYADLIQAKMSSSELLLLFYNGLKFKESKKLLHHFDFLENLCIEDLLKAEHELFYAECEIDKRHYPAIKFKSRTTSVV